MSYSDLPLPDFLIYVLHLFPVFIPGGDFRYDAR